MYVHVPCVVGGFCGITGFQRVELHRDWYDPFWINDSIANLDGQLNTSIARSVVQAREANSRIRVGFDSNLVLTYRPQNSTRLLLIMLL